MEPLWNGILLGLTLSILTGPILFTLVQTSIEQGFRAGMMFGLGIWTSDALYILTAFYGISYLLTATDWKGFDIALGLGGGIILIAVGWRMIVRKPPTINNFEKAGLRYSSFFSLWLKGFLINCLSPFTFGFWLFFTTALVAEKYSLISSKASFFYLGIYGTLILTDSVKIGLAKLIRRWLKPNFILWLRRIAGFTLIIFGIGLIMRVITDG